MRCHIYLPTRSSIHPLILSKKSINSLFSVPSPFKNYQLRIGVHFLHLLTTSGLVFEYFFGLF